jgi:cytochrome c
MSSSDLEKNKVFAAVLVAGIVAMLSGFVAKKVVHSEELEADAYQIEVVEVVEVVASGAPAAPVGPAPIIDLIADADIAKGEKLSKACMACHSFNQGGPNKIGPNLWGIYDDKVAHLDNFAYSDAMKNYGGAWTVAELNGFLWKPKKHMPGTKMNYIGMKKPEDRAAMVKYLQSLK